MDLAILADLRNIFAELYPDESGVRRVIADAGIDSSRIVFNAAAIDRWHSVLVEAEKIGRVDALLQVVEQEYGSNRKFRSACDTYRQESGQTSYERNNGQGQRIFAPRRRRWPSWLLYALAGMVALAVGLGAWFWPHQFGLPKVTPSPNANTTLAMSDGTATPPPASLTTSTTVQETPELQEARLLQVGVAQFANCARDALAADLVAEIEKSVSILPRVHLALLDSISGQRVARQQSGRDLIIWGRCMDENKLLLSFEILNPIGPEEAYQLASIEMTTSATVLDRADRMSRALMHYLLADMDVARQSFLALGNEATDARERTTLGHLRATGLLFQEQYDEAIAAFTALVQQDPLKAEALLNLGVARANQAIAIVTGEANAAEQEQAGRQNLMAAENFTEVISTSTTSDLQVLALVNRSATRYLWGGDLDAARADCQQAIDRAKAPSGYLCRAIVSITQLEKAKCAAPLLFEDARADLAAGQDARTIDWWMWAGHLSWIQLQCSNGGPDAEKYKREVQQFYAHYLDRARTEPFQLATDRFFVNHARRELSNIVD